MMYDILFPALRRFQTTDAVAPLLLLMTNTDEACINVRDCTEIFAAESLRTTKYFLVIPEGWE